MKETKRAQRRSQRPVNKETFIEPWPEAGLIATDSPNDPQPSLIIDEGIVLEMDGVRCEDFDLIDRFIVEHSLDLEIAESAMSMPSIDIARMLADINISRDEILTLTRGCTAAKLVDVIRHMNVLEMMIGLVKMRARRTPANQAHVTNRKEHPALLAADAAEAALRGFNEVETTVGVSRYAPLNALAILVGSQIGRGGVLTQCSVEEATNLRLGFRGLTAYSETLSVYGTEQAFVDGDDTPWSKAFLASAYASRGVKTRFTSGTGSEALMGYAEGKSMLYLEARCLLVTRGAGSQGTQNGSISCIALPESLPGGVRAVLAENLIATMLGLEVAAGNDALASHSEMRKSAKLMLQFIPGADFVTSGYGSIPRYDNMFGGGNFDVTELDDWYVIQRDMKVDGGIQPIQEKDILEVRRQGAQAIQAIFSALDFASISDEEVEAAVGAFSSENMPDRDRVADIKAAQLLLNGPITIIEIIRSLEEAGYHKAAVNLVEMQRQRVIGDFLQTSGIFESDGAGQFRVLNALTDQNDYRGPGSGYRVQGERWEKIQNIPQAWNPQTYLESLSEKTLTPWLQEGKPAHRGRSEEEEVIIAIGPAFGKVIHYSLSGLDLRDVLDAIMQGIRDEGGMPRVIRVHHTSDCAFIGHTGAKLSGSDVAIGIQSKGTTVIHRSDLAPLENLELFSMSPSLTLETYRQIGRNAARYAQHKPTPPVPVEIDNTARLRLIVQTTLLHRKETDAIEVDRPPSEVRWIK
jgi:propanediol dehydratase large subunit